MMCPRHLGFLTVLRGGQNSVITGGQFWVDIATMGSCGAIETILTLYMMQEGFIAPTLNLEEPDERCAMIRHTMTLEARPIAVAAIQNFAFGGVNTCLLIKRFV